MHHGHGIGLSVAFSLSGQVTEALELLEQTVGQLSPKSLTMSRMPANPSLGEVYLLAGR